MRDDGDGSRHDEPNEENAGPVEAVGGRVCDCGREREQGRLDRIEGPDKRQQPGALAQPESRSFRPRLVPPDSVPAGSPALARVTMTRLDSAFRRRTSTATVSPSVYHPPIVLQPPSARMPSPMGSAASIM